MYRKNSILESARKKPPPVDKNRGLETALLTLPHRHGPSLERRYFKNLDIRDIGAKTIDHFHLSLGGSPKLIQNYLGCLHKMLSDALDWRDTGKLLKFPKIHVPEVDFQTIDLGQQEATIQNIPDQMGREYILFTARQMVSLPRPFDAASHFLRKAI
jgi:hypothetical protein